MEMAECLCIYLWLEGLESVLSDHIVSWILTRLELYLLYLY